MRATNAEAMMIICPHCGAGVGERCQVPSGGLSKIHATRRWFANRPPAPPPKPAPRTEVPLATVRPTVTKRPSAPRTRGAPKVTGVSYRVKASRRSPTGGMWVAVMASVVDTYEPGRVNGASPTAGP